MKYLQLAVILGLIPASPVLADSLEREEALKLPLHRVHLFAHINNDLDAGKIHTTLTQRLSPINAANLKRAHAFIKSGKIVLKGF